MPVPRFLSLGPERFQMGTYRAGSDTAITQVEAGALENGVENDIERKNFTAINAFSSDEVELLAELAGDLAYGVAALRVRAAHEAAAKALRQSEERLAAVIRSAMDAIITLDERQRIVVFNAAAEKTFGIHASEAMGQPLDRCIRRIVTSGYLGHHSTVD